MNEAGDLVIKDMEKAKIQNAFFTLGFTGQTTLLHSQVPETNGKVRSKEDLP